MATRTEPISMCSLSSNQQALADVAERRSGSAVSGTASALVGGLGAPAPDLWVRPSFGSDQLIEPADVTLDRLQAVPLQLEGVTIDALPGPGEPCPEGFDSFFHAGTPSFQDAEPDIRGGQAEEGEPYTEPVVLPRGWSGLGEQVLQVLFAVGGQPVDDLGTTSGQRLGGFRNLVLGDETPPGEILEAGVQGAVSECPEG